MEIVPHISDQICSQTEHLSPTGRRPN